MEIWDAYDKDEVKLDFDLVRGEPIPAHVYHLVCDTVVRHLDGDFLLMQRALDKEGWPGCWEVGAGGSALKGEAPPQCAKRELLEECGIEAGELKQIYHTHRPEGHAIHYGYLCITDCPKDSVTLQEGETIAYKWISKGELLKFLSSGDCIEPQKKRLKSFMEELNREA